MNYIGAHISSSGGLKKIILRACQIKATAFSFFTKNPLQWHSPLLTEKNINSFKNICIQYRFTPKQILPHSSYLMNLGHPDNKMLNKSRILFLDEMMRCSQLGLNFLNFQKKNIHSLKFTTYKILKNYLFPFLKHSENIFFLKTINDIHFFSSITPT